MNKWLLVWNTALAIMLLALVVNGCSSYDPKYDNLYEQVETNRQNIIIIAEATEEALNLVQKQLDSNVETNQQTTIMLPEATEEALNLVQKQFYANTEYIEQNREAIIQMGNIVNQQSEYLNQQSSDLNKLKLLLQVLAAL